MATAPSADAAIVRRLRERDRSAWGELYEEFAPRLLPFAYRLTGNRHDADDLVQETFVRALPRLDRLDPDTVELGPYLFATLRNLFLKSVERRRRAEPVADVPEPDLPAPIEDDPERSTLLRRQQEEVRVANERLAPRQRLVLALRELEDRSYAEIGVVVGLNENAVAQLISRARENLRHELRLAQVDPERLPEECRRFLPLLSRHLDGQLRGAQLDDTLAHLEGCERCQETLAAMREAQRRYRVLLPPFGDGVKERERIDAELTSRGYWQGAPRRPRRRGRRALAAASVALVALGGVGVGAAVLATEGDRSSTRAATPPKAAAATPPKAAAAGATTSAAAATRATGTTKAAVATTAGGETTTQTTAASGPAAPQTTAQHTAASRGAATTAPTTAAIAPPPTGPALAPKPKPTTQAGASPPVEPTTAPVDEEPPTVTITARPAAEAAGGDATFSFRASEPGAFLSCRLDHGAFAPCSSPATYHALAPGPHSFSVRARDAAGNTGPAAVFGWTVLPPPDTTPPTVTIVSASTPGTDATFEFTSSEPGSTFACALDGGTFEPCSSPRVYPSLAPGRHSFAVRATDAAGNTGPEATHSWSVARPLPDLVVSALTETGFTVTNVGSAAAGPFVVSVTLIGTFTFAGLEPGRSATRTWSACRVGTLTAVADRGRTVAEADEGNNTRSLVSDC